MREMVNEHLPPAKYRTFTKAHAPFQEPQPADPLGSSGTLSATEPGRRLAANSRRPPRLTTPSSRVGAGAGCSFHDPGPLPPQPLWEAPSPRSPNLPSSRGGERSVPAMSTRVSQDPQP